MTYHLKWCHLLLLTCFTIACMEEVPETSDSISNEFMIGAFTGMATTCAIEPIVYLKNCYQRNETPSTRPRIFYRGLFVNMAGLVPTLAIQNSVFKLASTKLESSGISPELKTCLAACAAGIASAIPCTPRELIIVQQQIHGGPFYEIIRKIILKHGFKQLLRGMLPVAIRNSSFAGCFFGIAPCLQKKIEKTGQDNTRQIADLGPFAAGSLSALLTHPIDTVKTTMHADLQTKGIMPILRKILYNGKKPSLKHFYRGLFPRLFGVSWTMLTEYKFQDYFRKKIDT